MEIKIQNACPYPMRDSSFSEESLWRHSAEIQSPQRYLIKAPSGTGKTSLIHFMYGFRSDYEGNITVNNKESKHISLSEWASLRQRKFTVILQDMRLLPTLTLGENLKVKNRLTNHKTEAQMKSMMEQLGLGHKWDQPAGTLSIGQQQRVSIVRALLQPFELIMMDEPFSHIDQKNIQLASELIKEECKANNAGFVLFSLGDHYEFEYDKIYKL
jgi:putative ABC transport system ATP-binding protein